MGLKLLVLAIGVLLALAAAFAAACFVRAFGATYLGRAGTGGAAQTVEADCWSLAAILAARHFAWQGSFRESSSIGFNRPRPRSWLDTCRPQAGIPWLSIIPVSASLRSYDGLLLFGLAAASASLATIAVHRFASRTVRRAPFRDCRYSGLGVVARYSATSPAQPIRQLFATMAFAAHERVKMPQPGDKHPPTLAKVSARSGLGFHLLAAVIDAARMVKRHADRILCWFDSNIAIGLTEGINRLVQAAKAKARGYSSICNLKAMIYLLAGKLDLKMPA
jgi:hydrogenase-4 component B